MLSVYSVCHTFYYCWGNENRSLYRGSTVLSSSQTGSRCLHLIPKRLAFFCCLERFYVICCVRGIWKLLLKCENSKLKVACSRLSDSGKTQKKKAREKFAGREKGNGSFLPCYFRVCAFLIQRTRLSRSLEQAKWEANWKQFRYYLSGYRAFGALYVSGKLPTLFLSWANILPQARRKC